MCSLFFLFPNKKHSYFYFNLMCVWTRTINKWIKWTFIYNKHFSTSVKLLKNIFLNGGKCSEGLQSSKRGMQKGSPTENVHSFCSFLTKMHSYFYFNLACVRTITINRWIKMTFIYKRFSTSVKKKTMAGECSEGLQSTKRGMQKGTPTKNVHTVFALFLTVTL